MNNPDPATSPPPPPLTRDQIVARARELVEAGDASQAIELIERFLATRRDEGPPPLGLHLVRGLAYLRHGVPMVALQSFEAELFLDPHNAQAREQLAAVSARLHPPGSSRPSERPWQTILPAAAGQLIERATQRYTYRGVPLLKNCFDLAIYPLLFQQARPATIIEIGTLYGGSALWLSDVTGAMGLDTHIYTIDVTDMAVPRPPRVTVLRGNGQALGRVLTGDFLAQIARPLLVIEDADHSLATSLAVLKFFHPVLRSGEYIVIEDGMTATGALDALRAFLGEHGDAYDVDANYCDYFGANLTWCVNGFLRKR
jgi:cephalosporin hydroxylase